jgi:hypothetical protein
LRNVRYLSLKHAIAQQCDCVSIIEAGDPAPKI